MKSFKKWALVSLCVAAASPLANAEQSAPQSGYIEFRVGDRIVNFSGYYYDVNDITKDGYVPTVNAQPIEFNKLQEACIQRQLDTFETYISDLTDPNKRRFLSELKPKFVSVHLRDFTRDEPTAFRGLQTGLTSLEPQFMLSDGESPSIGFIIDLIKKSLPNRPLRTDRCQVASPAQIDRAVEYQMALKESRSANHAELKAAATEFFGKLAGVNPTEAAKADQDATDSQLLQRGRDAAAKMAQSQPGSSGQASPVR